MATIIRYDNGANPGINLTFDDQLIEFGITSTDDGGVAKGAEKFTTLSAQSAVNLVRGGKAGQILLDVENGLIWAIAPDGSSMFTVQKDDNTPQQVALTPPQTGVITSWLISCLSTVFRGGAQLPPIGSSCAGVP